MSDKAPTHNSECYFEKHNEFDTEIADSCEKVFNSALESARRLLLHASKKHSELEEIYGEHMNFEKNTALSDELIAKIETEL